MPLGDQDTLAALLGLLGTPMRGQQLLPGLYDPTGIGFEQPGGGLSSELNMVVGPDEGKYRMIPSLAPGQVGIESILANKRLSPQQMAIAQKYAQSRAAEVPTFPTLQGALDYEKRRHAGLDLGYSPQRPEDQLSALLLSLPRQR